MTPNGHFTSLTAKLANYARYRDAAGLSAYLDGQEFWDHLFRLREDHKRRRLAIRALSEATAECKAALDAKAPIPLPGTRRITWDQPTIARLRSALAKGGSERACRELGITEAAVRRARHRYCGSMR